MWSIYYDVRIYAMWHWHEEFEVHIVEKGAVRFRVGRETYILEEGEAAFVNSRDGEKAYYGQRHPTLGLCAGKRGSLVVCEIVYTKMAVKDISLS